MSLSGPQPVYLQPVPDGRQSPPAAAVQRGVCRLLRDHDCAVLTEFTLATGKRADVAVVKPDGSIWIIEIKSSPADFLGDKKWPEYRAYCDHLFFAIPPELDPTIMPLDAGLIIADRFGADILRQAPLHMLSGARRKALTLAFARAAAMRLHRLWDP